MNTVSTQKKVIRWMDIKTGKVQYGIDIKINGKWYHVSNQGKPCFYPTRKEAKEAMIDN